MGEQLELLPGYLTAHLQLALVALLLGACVSIPLGIWIRRYRHLQMAVLATASVVQTVPSLALLALMVPLLAFLGRQTQAHLGFSISSIGFTPALIALLLYSILPILRNTVTGLAGVDNALLQAALGVGMTGRQRLWRVELPHALPTIVAGVRTAAIWVVGMTVLSTPVGAPSLGNYIFTGLQTRNYNAVTVGCISAAVLALGLDWLVRSIEIGLVNRSPRRFWLSAGAMAALYGYVAVSFVASWTTDARELRVGAKTFTEQYILAEVLAQKLRDATHRPVRIVNSLGSNVAFDALRDGQIDVYVEYTGTIWASLIKKPTQGLSPEAIRAGAIDYVRRVGNAEAVARLGFENAYALAVREPFAQEHNLRTVADLARMSPGLSIAGDYEFFGRSEWQDLRRHYDLAFKAQRVMDPALMYQAIGDKAVDVISAYQSDGRLQALNLRLLVDDKHAVAPYDAMVLVDKRLQQDAAVMEALRGLNDTIDLKTMQRMDYQVDHDGAAARDVAAAFLAGQKRPQP